MPPQFAGAFGFVGAPLDRVSEELLSWHTELGFQPRPRVLERGLGQAAHQLLPLDRTPYRRSLLVGTRASQWTAYFDASLGGGDPRGAVSVLGRRLAAPQLVVYALPFRDEPDAVPGVRGGLQWEFSADGSSSNHRSIALVEGEGSSPLHFEAWGPVQPWETPDAYTARQKRKRLTTGLIADYCRALSIEPFDPAFYCGPSVLIERTN
jgi:hypothetical protein